MKTRRGSPQWCRWAAGSLLVACFACDSDSSAAPPTAPPPPPPAAPQPVVAPVEVVALELGNTVFSSSAEVSFSATVQLRDVDATERGSVKPIARLMGFDVDGFPLIELATFWKLPEVSFGAGVKTGTLTVRTPDVHAYTKCEDAVMVVDFVGKVDGAEVGVARREFDLSYHNKSSLCP